MDHLWIAGVDARWGWYPTSIDKECILAPNIGNSMDFLKFDLQNLYIYIYIASIYIYILRFLFGIASNGNLWRTFKATCVLRKFGSTTYARLQWLMIRKNCVMSLLSWWQILLYFQSRPWCKVHFKSGTRVLIGLGSSRILTVATAWAQARIHSWFNALYSKCENTPVVSITTLTHDLEWNLCM